MSEEAHKAVSNFTSSKFRSTITNLNRSKRFISEDALGTKIAPLLDVGELEILERAEKILHSLGEKLVNAKKQKAITDKKTQEESDRLDRKKQLILLTSYPKPADIKDAVELLIMRLSLPSIDFLNRQYTLSNCTVERNLKSLFELAPKYQEKKLLNLMETWWLEIYCFLIDAIWKCGEHPTEREYRNFYNQYLARVRSETKLRYQKEIDQIQTIRQQ